MSDKLTSILQNWAASRASGNTRELAAHIFAEAALRHREARPAEESRARRRPASPWLRLAYAFCGICIGLGAVAMYFWHGSSAPDEPEFGAVSRELGITGEQAETSRVLFAEMEHLFSDQFRWLAASDGELKLGVAPVHGGVARDSLPLQYRLTILERRADDEHWRTAFAKDVLLRSEELVEMACGEPDENVLALWLLPLGDGKVLVEAGLTLRAPAETASWTSAVLDLGRPAEVISTRSAEAEYRIYQSIVLLRTG